MNTNKEVYIIGAGVSGLIAAYELEQAGYHPILIEQTDAVGGRVKTLEEKGFALDLGFQVLLSAYPLAKKYLDFDALETTTLASCALIYSNGKSYQIGDPLRDLKLLFPTLTANIGTLKDKLKILQLNTKLKRKSLEEIFETPETSTLQYLQTFGFSKKIIRTFFRPFFAGIFLEPNLSTSSRMFEFVYKMFGEGYATIPKLGIGEISKQLKAKLNNTQFRFNTAVKEVTDEIILLESGEKIPHQGVIMANSAFGLQGKAKPVNWKSCICLYFEVDQTNIPKETIALVADDGRLSNNLYAYTDSKSGKTVLSVTTLKHEDLPEKKVIETITQEVKDYTQCHEINFIKSYSIGQALPDIRNLKMTVPLEETQLSKNVFLAGDHLLNGSLNAAMESGRLAALGLEHHIKSNL